MAVNTFDTKLLCGVYYCNTIVGFIMCSFCIMYFYLNK